MNGLVKKMNDEESEGVGRREGGVVIMAGGG